MSKITKYINWFFAIIGAISAIIGLIEYQHKILIFWISGFSFFLFLLIKIFRYFYFQRNEIMRLKARVKDVELTSKVATFKKWELVFSHLWYSNLNVNPENDVDLSLFEVINEFNGKNRIRDSIVTFNFKGRFNSPAQNFKIIFGNAEYTEFEKINFSAYDNITKTILNSRILPDEKGRDTRIKDVIISLKQETRRGDILDISINFIWPNGADIKSDYFCLSNIYSKKTDNIRFILKKPKGKTFSLVEVYKYNIDNETPIYVCDIEEQNGSYIFESNNPEKDTDYLMYYE